MTIQQVTETQNAIGEAVESWSDLATVYGAVVPLTGREFFQGAERQADISHRIEIRYREGIVAKMRAVHRGRLFNIEAVLNRDERDREIHLMCKELVA